MLQSFTYHESLTTQAITFCKLSLNLHYIELTNFVESSVNYKNYNDSPGNKGLGFYGRKAYSIQLPEVATGGFIKIS